MEARLLRTAVLLAGLLAGCAGAPEPARKGPPTPETPYSFVGRLKACTMLSQVEGAVLPTTDADPRWAVEALVLEPRQGTPPVKVGEAVRYAVHSIALTFPDGGILGRDYLFSVLRIHRATGFLHQLRVAPR